MDLSQFMFFVRIEFSSFKIRSKGQSLLMKVIAFLLLVLTFGTQKKFMTEYVTTIGTTVYVPDDWGLWSEQRRLAVLRHERVHMRQAKKYGRVLFSLLYLLAPLPIGLAWFRARFEWEAYVESMRAVSDVNGTKILDDDKYRRSIIEQFTTGAYGWMWPFPKTVGRWYDKAKQQIRDERANVG